MTYEVVLTHDWSRSGSGAAARQVAATAEWVGPGSWLASWPTSHVTARKLLDRCAAGEDPSREGLLIRARGAAVPAFAGVVTHATYVDGAVEGYAPDSIVVGGVSDMAVLAGEVSTPDPVVDSSTTALTTWAVYADGGWATAEDAIVSVVRENLASTALARRQLAVLTVPDSQGRGGPISYSKRFPTLLEFLRDVCLTSGLTVRVDRTTNGLVLVVGVQTRNTKVRWSRLAGTLSGAAVTYRAATTTEALVGGKGEGVARVFTRRAAAVPPGGWAYRRVQFVDDTGNDQLGDLRQSADKVLAEQGQGTSVATNPATNAPYELGKHYQVGDLTPVDAGTGTFAKRTILARVDSATLAQSGAGAWTTTPVIGEPLGTTDALTRRLIRDVRNRGKA